MDYFFKKISKNIEVFVNCCRMLMFTGNSFNSVILRGSYMQKKVFSKAFNNLYKKNYTIIIKILIISLILVPALIITANPVSASESIRIGTYDNKPLLFEENDQIKGFMIDLMNYIADKEDWDFEFIHSSWENSLNNLKNKQVDMLVAIAYSEERDEIFDFTNESFLTNWGQIYSHKNINIQSLFDLEGKKVAVLKEDIYYVGNGGIKELLSKFDIKVEYIELDSYQEIYTTIQNKKVDVGVVNRIHGYQNENKYDIKRSPVVLNPIELRVAFLENNGKEVLQQIDKHLKKLKEDKTSYYFKRLDYWLQHTEGLIIPKYLQYSFMALGLFLLVAIIIIYITRLQVKSKTQELELSNKELEEKNDEIESAYQQVDDLSRKLKRTIELTDSLSKSALGKEEDFLSDLLHTAANLISETDYGSVYLYEGDKVKFIDTIGHDLSSLQQIPILRKNFSVGKENINIINNIISHTTKNMDEVLADKFTIATKPIKESLIFDLYLNKENIAGISLDIAKESDKKYGNNAIMVMNAFKSLASAFFTSQRYYKMQDEFQKDLILSIIQILEFHDSYTKDHSQNVALLSSKIAVQMGLSSDEINKAYWAGMVHDIGKILIPSDILNKNGKLTKEEFEQIKRHPCLGYKTLSQSKSLRDISEYVLHHHERWDGNGYPNKLYGEEIHIISQILTLADSWDAMRSDRSYRKGLAREVAIKEIINKKGLQFSPKVVDAFLKVLNNSSILTRVP